MVMVAITKSVRDLIQLYIYMYLRPLVVTSLRYSLRPSGLLKCVETLDSVSNYYCITTAALGRTLCPDISYILAA